MSDGEHQTDRRNSLWIILQQLYRGLSRSRRRQFHRLVALMTAGAAAELVSVAAVLPFLTVLTTPDRAFSIAVVRDALRLVGANRPDQLLLAVTVFFGAAIVSAAVVRIVLARATNKFTYDVGHDFAVEIQRRILYQSYIYHVTHNSGDIVASLQKVSTFVYSVLLQTITAVVSIFISLFIIAGLLYIDWKAAASVGISFIAIYALVMVTSRRRLAHYSEEMSVTYSLRVRLVQESLGGIRDIIIDKTQPLYVQAFRAIDQRLSSALASSEFRGAAPRFIIEGAGMLILAAVAYALASRGGGLIPAIPVIGALALGAQRLLPLLQQIYLTWNSVSARKAIARDIRDLLQLPMPHKLPNARTEPLKFCESIVFDNVSFAYPSRDEIILDDIHLTIPQGSRIAVVGKTGSGKSTLLDLLMGLLEPTEGRILIDGTALTAANRESWQSNVAHVPQSIFLADTSIARNIAFGESDEQMDWGRLEAAARRAQLLEFVSSLPAGFATEVGERGVRLSGGQRQRVGIARALYKNARVLILDEATSALDNDTETAVVSALDEINAPTIIMVAHRLSSIASCDRVICLEQSRIAQIASYAEVVRNADPNRPH